VIDGSWREGAEGTRGKCGEMEEEAGIVQGLYISVEKFPNSLSVVKERTAMTGECRKNLLGSPEMVVEG